MHLYDGRPGLSPVNAALLAAGVLRPGMLALDVGAGDGNEATALAEQGLAVVALDRAPDPDAPRLARSRGVELGVHFVEGDALALDALFRPRTFDAALDVLAYNNVCLSRGPRHWRATANAYARQVARVLRPGGVWVIQWRAEAARAKPNVAWLEEDLPTRAARHFDVAGPFWTHIPEYVPRKRTAFAPTGAAILTRR